MITYLFFLFLAVLTIASALMVVSVANPVHSVLFLIFCFFSSAGIFIIGGAEFVSMILLVVYVGAVAVLFMFVVMMMDMDRNDKDADEDKNNLINMIFSQQFKSFKKLFVLGIGKVFMRGLLSTIVFMLSVGSLFSIFNILNLLPNDLTVFGLYNAVASGDFISGEYLSRITLFLQSSDYGLETFLIGFTLIASLLFSFVLAFGFMFNEGDKNQEDKKRYLQNIPWPTFVVGFIFFEFLLVLYRHGFSSQEIGEAAAVAVSSVSNTHQIAKVLYTDNIVAFQLASIVLLLSMIGAIVLTMHHKKNVKRQSIADQVSRRKADTCKLVDPEIGKGVDL